MNWIYNWRWAVPPYATHGGGRCPPYAAGWGLLGDPAGGDVARLALFLFKGGDFHDALAQDAGGLAGGFDLDGVLFIRLLGGLSGERAARVEGTAGGRVGR